MKIKIALMLLLSLSMIYLVSATTPIIYLGGPVVVDNVWNINGSLYLYNNSGILDVNDTKLNFTISSLSINESYGNATYYLKSNPSGFLNISNITDYSDRVLNTTYIANPYAWLNTTNASLLYYNISNPSNFINTSNLTGYINQSYANATYYPLVNIVAQNISAGTFGAGNYVFDTNVTLERIIFEANTTKTMITANSSCSLIYGATSTLAVC